MVGGAVPLAVYRGGDLAAGPLTLSRHAVSPQLKAISLEYSHAELATATANFHPSKRLGAGCYGAVYRGELKDGSDVAIKAIDLSILIGKGDCPQDAGFDEEVQLLSKFRHPHLVTLLGWGQHGLHRYLVYEFLSGGDVFQRLHKSKRGLSFPWHERLSVLLDAASGLSHMHNATPKAFHRDIKSANILLDRHHTAKMADFGLACTSLHGASNVAVKSIGGTPGYKCPVYERSGCCTEGSEVYSFGMVMLEVLTGLAPSATDQTVPGGISFPIAEKVAPQQPGALERMRGGDSTAEWPPALFKELATMALRCVDASERLRPHFVDLVRFLKSLAGRFPKTEFAVAMATMATMAPAVPGQVMSSRAPATPMSGRIATRQFEPRLCQSETKPLVVEDGCDGRHFVLELQESAACKIEALSSEWRWLPLVSEGHCAVVGRHLQQALFEAWLPCPQHACISRRAIEIYWDPNGEAKLVACGSNPVLVDGVQVEKGAGGAARLLPGSEICFAYDGKVLLRLRYLAFESCSFTPQWSLECSRRLAADDLERWRIPMLPGVSSVTEAVDRLNSGKAKCSDGLCIVFCPADCQYFLLYRKGCKAAALAAREGTGPRRSLAWTPPEEAFCELRCLQAEGMTRAELQALPLEHREMPVPLGYSFIKTEVLLREPSNDPQSLHGLLQLHAEPKVLSLTMLQRRAGVAVYIDEEELVPGFARRLQQGQVLIVVKQDGSTQRTVLVLQVHWFYEPDKVSSTAGPVTTRQTRGTDRSVPTLNSPSQKSLQPRSTAEIQRFRSEPGGVLPPPRCRAKQEESEVEAPAVFLEISGSSAKDLPVAQRRLGPMTLRNQPWIIGRRHQKEFLQRTVKEESLEFISRDHFAIAYREGSFLLLALSQNRIWVDRGKVGIRSLQQDEMMPLRPGDRILLGTAPDDATSTRDSKARLDWLFQIQEQN